jgi:hypothetical protein
MKKRLIVLIALVVSAIICVPAINSTAQQAPKPLTVGDPVIDQFRGSAEAKYAFSGKADEYYALNFYPGAKSKVASDVSILDSVGKPLDKHVLFHGTLVKLPVDGEYTVNLKRKGAATGEFVLQLYRVSTLEKGKPVDAEISSYWSMDKDRFTRTDQYFVIQSDSDVRLTVKVGERKFPPRVTSPIMYWISQPSQSDPFSRQFFSGTVGKVVAFNVTLSGSPNFYVLELMFNGYGREGNPVGNEILTQKFTVLAEK